MPGRSSESVAVPRADLQARRRARGPCPLILAVVAALALTPVPASSEKSINNTKAEMLLNLARFVEWPSQRLRSGNQMTFAILGDDDLAGVIAAEFSSKTINGRDVFVRCVRRVEDVEDGHVLFIASSEAKRIPDILKALRSNGVLTVADVTGFAALGGMVEFVQQGEKVRFDVNLDSARQAKLKMSAKLLALATIVAHAP